MTTPIIFPEVLDSSMLSSFTNCPQLFFRAHIEHWKLQGESIHLHAGSAYAKGLEAARRSYMSGDLPSIAEGKGLGELIHAYGDFEAGQEAKSLPRMCGALEFYFSQYPLQTDIAKIATVGGVPAVEWSFAIPLPIKHPETGNPLLFCGRTDALVQLAGGLYALDDKTTSQLGASWCFHPSTEVLSATGWKSIAELAEGELIMQVSVTGKASFAKAADVHAEDFSGELVSLSGRKILQLITPNHRILLNKRRGGIKVVQAAELTLQDNHHAVPCAASSCEATKLPEVFQRYICALQADGTLRQSEGIATGGQGHREHMPHPAASFNLTKPRKIARLREILESLETDYTENDGAFYISGFTELQAVACTFLTPDKHFKPELAYMFDDTFIEELEHWDGWQNQYYTIHRENADFVQTVGHLCGYRVSIAEKVNHTTSFVVCISEDIDAQLKSIDIGTVTYNGKVYCTTVPDSFLLTRMNGKISVSGNSRQWDLRGQFIGYAWAMRTLGLQPAGTIVRGVSILKTKYDTLQAIIAQPDYKIDRWYEQLEGKISQMLECWQTGKWRYVLDEACNHYGQCPMRQVCLSNDPEPWLRTYYEKSTWNPLTREEKK